MAIDCNLRRLAMPARAGLMAAIVLITAIPARAVPDDAVIAPPAAADWAALAHLPDWSGVWTPDIRDQDAQVETNPVPWTPALKKQVDFWTAEENAGRPHGVLIFGSSSLANAP